MSVNDGGPAFPDDGQQNYTGGMTLRDYFAAKALQGMLANEINGTSTYREDAECAYRWADAMLKARQAA